MDEISIGKGHRYLVVVLDLDCGVVVFRRRRHGRRRTRPVWNKLRASPWSLAST